ncbi:MAG: hypothetical protein J6D14_00555 [Lachnospiraceae bacterium]|nr:hypothetical protein [Lachnospiraceae bacterium]
MKQLRKIWIYAQRHKDFIFLDCIVYGLAFYIAILFRRSLDIPIRHGDLFIRFGLVGLVVYILMELIDQNLNGVVSRSMAREAEALGRHMTLSWSIYTVILFLRKDAHMFSRSVYVITFFTCYVSIFIARTIWKAFVKYGQRHDAIAPRILLICDSPRAQGVIDRLMRGTFENKYEIAAVIVNNKEGVVYEDHYPLEKGLDKIEKWIRDKHVQGAYVELWDANEEREVIDQLLGAGVIVHKSLGDSSLDYASMRINELSDKSVITIEDSTPSLAKKVDQVLVHLRRKDDDEEE